MNSERIKAAILDDEKPGIEMLQWNLEQYCPSIEVTDTFNDPVKALSTLKTKPPKILFLDIEMPAMNGFEFLKRFDELPFHVVFVTAYDQFAIRAFKVSAFDYLLKPIDKDDLIRCVNNFQKDLKKKEKSHQIELLMNAIENPAKNLEKIALTTLEGLEFVKVDDIIRCEADDNYTNVFLSGDHKILVSKTLKEIESVLKPHAFSRVHYSHLVNLNKIKKYVKGDGGYVVMENGDSVNVSRSKKEQFLSMFRG
ncbi:MAG: LytTR family DNA-binding domain-containing protein [Bacteroidota bacterium]